MTDTDGTGPAPGPRPGRRGARNAEGALLVAQANGGRAAARELTQALAPRALAQAARMLGSHAEAQAVALRHLEGLSNPEIAAVMEVGVEAVGSLAAQGKRAPAAALRGRKAELGHATERRDGHHPGDAGLDRLLTEARDLRPVPPEALMACILADAEAVSPGAAGLTAGSGGLGRLRALAGLLGDWPALGSLAASTLLGPGVGLAQPPAVSGAVLGLVSSIRGDGVSLTLRPDEDLLGSLGADLPAAAPVDG